MRFEFDEEKPSEGFAARARKLLRRRRHPDDDAAEVQDEASTGARSVRRLPKDKPFGSLPNDRLVVFDQHELDEEFHRLND